MTLAQTISSSSAAIALNTMHCRHQVGLRPERRSPDRARLRSCLGDRVDVGRGASCGTARHLRGRISASDARPETAHHDQEVGLRIGQDVLRIDHRYRSRSAASS